MQPHRLDRRGACLGGMHRHNHGRHMGSYSRQVHVRRLTTGPRPARRWQVGSAWALVVALMVFGCAETAGPTPNGGGAGGAGGADESTNESGGGGLAGGPAGMIAAGGAAEDAAGAAGGTAGVMSKPPNLRHPATIMTPAGDCRVGEDAPARGREIWILGGQSNAIPEYIFPPFANWLEERVPGLEVQRLTSVFGASAISRWDEGRDAWASLQEKVAGTSTPITGLVWYQGEGDASNPDGYDERLADLFSRVRALTKNPQLRVIVVQLANNAGNGGAAKLALLRELQARYVQRDPLAAIVPALDLAMRDYVHIQPTSREEVGRRAAIAAMGLAYGADCAHAPGMHLEAQRFADASRKAVVVTFTNVHGRIEVADRGWENAFGVMAAPIGPADQLPPSNSFAFKSTELIYPDRIEVIAANQVILHFAQPLPADAVMGFALAGNNRTSSPFGEEEVLPNVPMAGLEDAEGFPPLAYFPRPIAPAAP